MGFDVGELDGSNQLLCESFARVKVRVKARAIIGLGLHVGLGLN